MANKIWAGIFEVEEQSEVQKMRGELEAESQRLPEAHRLSAGEIDQFMGKARRSRLTRTEEGLAEFRLLCERLGLTAKQVSGRLAQVCAAIARQGVPGTSGRSFTILYITWLTFQRCGGLPERGHTPSMPKCAPGTASAPARHAG